MMKVAVIGAGVTGCLLANRLKSDIVELTIFEKSRGCGGRVSTKRTDWGQCDLGATIVPASEPDFVHLMQGLVKQELATSWPQKILVSNNETDSFQQFEHFDSNRKHYVFNQKMSAVCRYWINEINLRTNSLVTELRYLPKQGWQLKVNESWLDDIFDKVVLTAPWPQSNELVQQSQLPFTIPKYSQSWASCWSIGLKTNNLVTSEADVIYLKNQLAQTLVRDSAKPQRSAINITCGSRQSEIWVVQLDNELSDRLGKTGKQQATMLAKQVFCQKFGLEDASISDSFAHYWRYARPNKDQAPLGVINIAEYGLLIGGDWSSGSSVEAAFKTSNELFRLLSKEGTIL